MPYSRAILDFANGSDTSSVLDVRAFTYAALHMPAAFSGATFTVLASDTADGNFNAVTDSSGAAVSITFAVSKVVELGDLLAGLFFVKLKSNVNQVAARTLVVTLT